MTPTVTTHIVNTLLAPRRRQMERFMQRPAEVQAEQLRMLLHKGASTEFGRSHRMHEITGAEQFARRVGIYDYDTFSGFIDRVRAGEQNIVWPEPVRWLAKSSGTTGSRSKYIPVTLQGLRQAHMRGPRDILALFCNLYPESRVLEGKMLTLGGSKKIEREGDSLLSGDLSSILIENTPWWAEARRLPDKRTALMPDFDEKVNAICRQAVGQNVTSFTGVPSWNLVMLNRILEYTGRNNILEVWPGMEMFVHGGMDFRPYRSRYAELFPSPQMKYMETYNASEGFFGIADVPGSDDMLLMLDYGIYYEFLPASRLSDLQAAVPLEGVRTGENYAMIITTCNGLWRYLIGDTVEFTSISPYRIRITGRTKHYINAFGEEIIIDNAEAAVHAACAATGAEVSEYTAAPVYMNGSAAGAHQWIVEFLRGPSSPEAFGQALDDALRRVNSDYDAKRFKDTTLQPPVVTAVPSGTFVGWMKSRGMGGGQHKVPRLFNDRTYADAILRYAGILEPEFKTEEICT